jgi:hypothetical protein
MDRDSVTFEQLDRLLGQLGFSRQIAPPNRVWYEHAGSDTVIILPDQKLGDPVRAPDWMSARVHLIEKGLVSEEELHEMLLLKGPPAKAPPGKKQRRG